MRLQQYDLLVRLSSRSMWSVYLVRDTEAPPPGRLLALKTLRPQIAEARSFRKAFLAKARTGRRLDHPNVVSIAGLGQLNGIYSIASEYVFGVDLQHVLRRSAGVRKPLTVGVLLQIFAALCDGAHYAHELAGDTSGAVIHGEITPQNIMIGFNGVPKLINFPALDPKLVTARLRSDMTREVLSYTSPEQSLGHPACVQSDIFSLGVVLWESLTGKCLFQGSTPEEALKAVREQSIEPPSSAGLLTPIVDAIVMKALCREPGGRYRTALEMKNDVVSLIERAGVALDASTTSKELGSVYGREIVDRALALRAAMAGKADLDVLAQLLGARTIESDELFRSAGAAQNSKTRFEDQSIHLHESTGDLDRELTDRLADSSMNELALISGEGSTVTSVYRHPTSALELMERRKAGETSFLRAQLTGAQLQGENLARMDLRESILVRSNLSNAVLLGANLESASLRGADLAGSRLDGANFDHACLAGACLRDATLFGASLLNCDLSEIQTESLERTGCRIDARTYIRSGWTPAHLVEWRSRGAILENLELFPAAARNAILPDSVELIVSLAEPASPYERVVLEALSVREIGDSSDCKVEIVPGAKSRFIRVTSSRRSNLEKLADRVQELLDERRAESSEIVQQLRSVLHASGSMKVKELELRTAIRAGSPISGTAWSVRLGADNSYRYVRPARLFISYAREDAECRRQLDDHLSTSKQLGEIETWHDQMISAGSKWETSIHERLEDSDAMVLLLSSDFLSSNYCMGVEVKRALEKPIPILPLMVRPVDIEGSTLAMLQCLPRSGGAVTARSRQDQDGAWVEIVTEIRRAMRGIMHP